MGAIACEKDMAQRNRLMCAVTDYAITVGLNSLALVNLDVGHAVHLRQLSAVQRRHQLPLTRHRGDEVLRHRHVSVFAHITEKEDINATHTIQ